MQRKLRESLALSLVNKDRGSSFEPRAAAGAIELR